MNDGESARKNESICGICVHATGIATRTLSGVECTMCIYDVLYAVGLRIMIALVAAMMIIMVFWQWWFAATDATTIRKQNLRLDALDVNRIDVKSMAVMSTLRIPFYIIRIESRRKIHLT